MADEATSPPSGPQTRALPVAVDDVSKSGRTVTAKINTAVVDRYRTVILPSGGDFTNFIRCPAVLWQHGLDPTRGSQAVGSCSSVRYRKGEDDIVAVTRFKTDEYSDRIFQNYVDGTLTAFSVDFIPDMSGSSRATPDELRGRPDWAGAECIYRKWELTGYSAVAYPGNPEALALCVERGLWIPPEARDMAEGSGAGGGYATEPKPGRCVAERDGMWCVCDGDTVVSRHETQAVAEHAMANPERAAVTGDEPGPDVIRTTPPPPIPEGIRTYTEAEIAGLIGRRVFDPMFAILDRRLKDADDLARGRV